MVCCIRVFTEEEVLMTGEHAKARMRRLQTAALAAAVLGAGTSSWAQIASLSKGQQLLVNNGLQIFAFTPDSAYPIHYNQAGGYNSVAATNCTGLEWGNTPTDMSVLGSAPGAAWGKWADYTGTPATALTGTE